MAWRVSTYIEAKRAGIYRCTTCDESELRLEVGEEAPRCVNCNRPVTWEFQRPLVGRIGFIPA